MQSKVVLVKKNAISMAIISASLDNFEQNEPIYSFQVLMEDGFGKGLYKWISSTVMYYISA